MFLSSPSSCLSSPSSLLSPLFSFSRFSLPLTPSSPPAYPVRPFITTEYNIGISSISIFVIYRYAHTVSKYREKKEEIWLSPMTTKEKSQKQHDNQKNPKKFD